MIKYGVTKIKSGFQKDDVKDKDKTTDVKDEDIVIEDYQQLSTSNYIWDEFIQSIDDVLTFISYKDVLIYGKIKEYSDFEEAIIENEKNFEYYEFSQVDLYNMHEICREEYIESLKVKYKEVK